MKRRKGRRRRREGIIESMGIGIGEEGDIGFNLIGSFFLRICPEFLDIFCKAFDENIQHPATFTYLIEKCVSTAGLEKLVGKFFTKSPFVSTGSAMV